MDQGKLDIEALRLLQVWQVMLSRCISICLQKLNVIILHYKFFFVCQSLYVLVWG